MLQSCDVLLNITGASIGRTAIVPNEFDEGNVNQHVCIIRSDGSRIIDISPELSSGIFSLPSWSPDGKQFVFDPLYSYQTSEIYFVDMNDGTVNERDVGVPFINTPTWSADGRWVLFDRAAPKGGDLWLSEASR